MTVKTYCGPENLNKTLLSQYPAIREYPHFFVLEKDGSFLHSQRTAELESGRSCSEEKMFQFLRECSPHSVSR